MTEHTYQVDWPAGFERTPPEQRERTSKFQAGFQQTRRDLRTEMERLGVEDWRLDDVTGSGGDPGVVVRWRKDGVDHAVACDAYTTKAANLRAVYLWINETRMRSQRPVETGQDEFATARLPPGEDEASGDVIVAEPAPEPHEILCVSPDAPDIVVTRAFQELVKEAHADQGNNPEYDVSDLKAARDALLKS